jgi:hypothetical protein
VRPNQFDMNKEKYILTQLQKPLITPTLLLHYMNLAEACALQDTPEYLTRFNTLQELFRIKE